MKVHNKTIVFEDPLEKANYITFGPPRIKKCNPPSLLDLCRSLFGKTVLSSQPDAHFGAIKENKTLGKQSVVDKMANSISTDLKIKPVMSDIPKPVKELSI